MLIHAAGESSTGNLPPNTYAIALALPNERALRRFARRLGENGIVHRGIYEPDAPYHGQLMAIGIYPDRKSKLRKLLSKLPLLK